MEINVLNDIITKISLLSRRFISYSNPQSGQWEYSNNLITGLEVHFTELLNAGPKMLPITLEKVIVSSFFPDKEIQDLFRYADDEFLENAKNEVIVNDTLHFMANNVDVNLNELRFCIDKCIKSIDTIDKRDANSFLLSPIEINLFNALALHPELMKNMHWREFEKLIANILESFKYDIELMQGTKDGGIDVIAIKKVDAFGAHRYLIQAKQWKNKVGVEPVQRLHYKQQMEGASKACLVTTSKFTRGAWNLANQYNYNLDLKDFDKLHEWVKQAALVKSNFDFSLISNNKNG